MFRRFFPSRVTRWALAALASTATLVSASRAEASPPSAPSEAPSPVAPREPHGSPAPSAPPEPSAPADTSASHTPSVHLEDPDEARLFHYVKPQPQHRLRAVLEVTTVLFVGQVDYLLNTSARGGTLQPGDQRWGLRYDWRTFRSKLVLEDYKLDTNQFNTNFMSHPLAGTLYYSAARANHLGVAESFGYAAVGALAWEYFGELREEVSVNDAIVTPVAGLAIGEASTQMSEYFARSRKNAATDVAAFIFGPIRAINDFADGASTRRSTDVDALGLSNDEWHAFELDLGGRVTAQPSRDAGGVTRTYGDATLAIDTRLVNLPGYGRAGRHSVPFFDGNVSRLHFDAAFTPSHLAGALFAAEIVPAGYYYRRAEADAAGRVYGEGLLVGIRAAFEYGVHDYDRDRARPIDLRTTLSPVGIAAEYTRDAGPLHLRAGVDVGGELAGVKSYAFGAYATAHPDLTNVQSVLAQRGYYYPLGVTAAPYLELRYGVVTLGGRVRVDSYQGLEGLDEQQERIQREVPITDRVVDLGATASVDVPGTALRVATRGDLGVRSGSVGEIKASQRESSLSAWLGVRF